MKSFLTLTLLCLVGCILANPINKPETDLYVTSVNNTAVCVVKKVVHHEGELLPSADPCEICRCRPPGFACAYVRCAPKEPRSECLIKKISGQCCPQYVCESNELPALPAADSSNKPELRSDDKPTEAPASEELKPTQTIEGRDELPSTASAIEQRSEDLKTTEAPREERLEEATKKPEIENAEEITGRSAEEEPATVEPKSAGSELPLPTASSERDPKLQDASAITLPPAEKKEERKDDSTAEPEVATGRADDSSSKPEEAASRAPKIEEAAAATEQNEQEATGRSESSEKPALRRRRDASQEDLDEEIANTIEPVSHLAAADDAKLPEDDSKEEEKDNKEGEQLLTVRSDLAASEAPKIELSDDSESKSIDKDDDDKATSKPEKLSP